MMNYARHTTLESVDGLSTEDLDYLQDKNSNSIGALLLHMAAIERIYQVYTLEEREPERDLFDRWGHALSLGDQARSHVQGHPLEYYVNSLASVRQTTLEEFGKRGDDWLAVGRPWGDNGPANNYFLWFHVIEDEINHRGQIRWLSSRVPGRNAN